MHRLRIFIGWLILISLLWFPISVRAEAPTPLLPPSPPIVEGVLGTPPTIPIKYSPSIAALTGLKAVLVAGSIDGDSDWTQKEITNLQRVAGQLRERGVQVSEFYPPNNPWNDIKAAASGAHFLLYRGHGVSWDGESDYGGFYLGAGNFVSPEQVRTLNLHPGAVVLLYGCFTAGSSGGEIPAITSAEARQRVTQYSDDFFAAGASAYYANWFGDAFDRYLTYLFNGETFGAAYEHATRDYWSESAISLIERTSLAEPAGANLWLGKRWDANSNGYVYDNAFAGLSGSTLASLFAPPMILSPAKISLLLEPGAPQQSLQVNLSAGSEVFNWTATANGGQPSWLTDYTHSGSSTQPLVLTITPPSKTGVYSASLQIQTDSPVVSDSSQSLEIRLVVVEEIKQVFLPALMR